MSELATIDKEMEVLGAELEAEWLRAEEPDLLTWFCQRNTQFDADIAALTTRYGLLTKGLKVEYEAMVKDIEDHRTGLYWSKGPEVESQVRREISSKKKGRHIKTLWGVVGFRKKPATSKAGYTDKGAALAFCQEHLPEAVEQAPKLVNDVVKKHLILGGKIAGAVLEETPERDEFYCKPTTKALPKAQAKLEGE